MPVEIIDCQQNSPEWLQHRLGRVTASEFSTVMAVGKDGGASLTRRTYMYKLAGEIITGQLAGRYTNDAMDRGHGMEDEARQFYAFSSNADPVQVGFIVNGGVGYSPDSLVGSDGLLEIKTKEPHVLLELRYRKMRNGDGFPSEHRAQCQGGLWVAEREWIDFIAYWPGMKPYKVRAYREDDYIEQIATAVARFREELHELVIKERAG